jgi:hypothetical protein
MARAKSKKVTEHRQKLANALAVSESPSADKAAQLALGYRAGSVTDAIATPEVARAVRAGLVRRLVAEAAPLSMGLLIKIVKQGHVAADKGESPTNTQADAAKSLIQFAGLQAIAEEKDVAEMSDNELKQLLEQVSSEATRRNAVEVEGTVSAPSDAPVEGQATEVDSLFS